MKLPHVPPPSRRLMTPRFWAGLCVFMTMGLAEASAQLPRSQYLEPQRSSFRPTPGERNPFTPVGDARSNPRDSGVGELEPALGASAPAHYRAPAEPAKKDNDNLVSGDSFRLSGILLDSKTPLAVIDGHSYTLGDKVPYEKSGIALEFTVSAIEDRQVTMTCQEVTVILKMKGSRDSGN